MEVKQNDVFDYLEWRGDLSFEQSGFNEVDDLFCPYWHIWIFRVRIVWSKQCFKLSYRKLTVCRMK